MNLSSLLKVDVSTYENPSMDCIVDQMEYDLDECKDDKDMIEVQWLGKVAIKDIEFEDNLDFDKFKEALGRGMQQALELCVVDTDLDTVFRKYGLEYAGMGFYTPKYYNYEWDSLDIHLKTTDNTKFFSVDRYWLRELIMEYIDKVRQESYDWYCSLEPTNLDEVGIDDYCTIRAILKKEWVYDDMKDCLQEFVDEWFSDLVRQYSNQVYMIRTPIWWEPPYERHYYKLDFDTKTLLIDKKNRMLECLFIVWR